jgi:hypothetical protein
MSSTEWVFSSAKNEVIGLNSVTNLWVVSFNEDDAASLFDHKHLVSIKLVRVKTPY